MRQMSAENQDPGYAGGDGREGSKAGKEKKPVAVPDSLEMEITFQQVNLADGAMRVTGTRRADAMTVAVKAANMEQLMAVRQVLFNAAAGFYNPLF